MASNPQSRPPRAEATQRKIRNGRWDLWMVVDMVEIEFG
jgi:hypothetical protein